MTRPSAPCRKSYEYSGRPTRILNEAPERRSIIVTWNTLSPASALTGSNLVPKLRCRRHLCYDQAGISLAKVSQDTGALPTPGSALATKTTEFWAPGLDAGRRPEKRTEAIRVILPWRAIVQSVKSYKPSSRLLSQQSPEGHNRPRLCASDIQFGLEWRAIFQKGALSGPLVKRTTDL